ncbi:hypothetical protein JTE90_018726 [Oedothorax gibbosus]|uniref:Uncharacterized protein n=1 Tax=Oedothorax gibbosus TaxID=931172 RepID=A0AAV6UIS4_9ARAC|nr:hypothetical protein JTE90_018726 [Oedothorax gibbosus]
MYRDFNVFRETDSGLSREFLLMGNYNPLIRETPKRENFSLQNLSRKKKCDIKYLYDIGRTSCPEQCFAFLQWSCGEPLAIPGVRLDHVVRG